MVCVIVKTHVWHLQGKLSWQILSWDSFSTAVLDMTLFSERSVITKSVVAVSLLFLVSDQIDTN
jgi:hypothetical protein